jgi:hypothetical protein
MSNRIRLGFVGRGVITSATCEAEDPGKCGF